MAIYTPRGLKIRIKPQQAFMYMGRLFPQVTASQILKTTEGLESLPAAHAFLAAIIALSTQPSTTSFFTITLLGAMTGLILRSVGSFTAYGYKIGEYYSYLAGYGLYLIIIVLASYEVLGWIGPVLFFGAKIVYWVIETVAEIQIMKSMSKTTGLNVTTSEVNFLNANLIHAHRIGKKMNLLLEPEDDNANATYSYRQLLADWPKIVSRFNDE